MSSKALKGPFLRAVANRGYAQAAANPAGCPPPEVKKTVLPNKLTVASLDNGSPISRVSILFRAGSRFETPDNLGSTHFLRATSGLATQCYSYFGITRRIQQVGGNLNCTGDREIIAYTLEATNDVLEEGLDILASVAAQSAFKPWEVAEIIPRVELDLAILSPSAKALDLLHKAAFRSGLGNSLFCPKHLVKKISTETLQHYVRCNYTNDRAAIVGVGVQQERLLAYAQNLTLENCGAETCGSPYKGGEIRIDASTPVTTVAVGVEGACVKNEEEALAYGILQHALGVGPSVKWGSQETSPLGKVVAGLEPAAVTAFNACYGDSGLFGFVAASSSSCIGKVVEGAVKQLRCGGVSEADIAKGKAQLKGNILMSLESSTNLISEIGSQVLLTGDYQSAADIVCAIDSVQNSDVNAAAKKVAGGKLSIGAVGNMAHVPYIDELK